MEKNEIRREFRRITRRSFFKQDMPVRETEVDIVTQVERITRRQRATRVISGSGYILIKKANNMI